MFYVYEWFKIENLEVFYVGKGTGMRRFELHNRSKYFMNVYNKHRCAVRLVHQSLTNEKSCELEIERIYEMKMIGQAKCNFTNGGTGFSTGLLNPTRIKPHFGDKNGMRTQNIDFKGEKNPFYGKLHTDNTKAKISSSRTGKGGQCGELNGMYGSNKTKGELNGMYGRTGFSHPNSKMYQINYLNDETEILKYKECTNKFGIAFVRIYETGGLLHYKKKSVNSIYENAEVIRLK